MLVPRTAQPIILERRRLEHDGLVCVAKNCAHKGALVRPGATCRLIFYMTQCYDDVTWSTL